MFSSIRTQQHLALASLLASNSNTILVTMVTLESLPDELQLMVFEFAYSHREIHIAQDKNQLERVAPHHEPLGVIDKVSMDTSISRRTQPAAWQAYLGSATWTFSSLAAAARHIDTYPSIMRQLKHIRANAREIDIILLIRMLSRAGCKLRSIELGHCTADHLGIRCPKDDAAPVLQRNEAEVIQHCLDRSCQATSITTVDSLIDCALARTLTAILTLEKVVIQAECDFCQTYTLDCDWRLFSREAELWILQAVAQAGLGSHARSRSILQLQCTIASMKEEFMVRQQHDSIDIHCGTDIESELESDDDLQIMFS